jgi:hypothetical protein
MRVWRDMHGQAGGDTGVDNEIAKQGFENMGAWILGRNMFGPVRGPWPDDNWKGWWGDDPSTGARGSRRAEGAVPARRRRAHRVVVRLRIAAKPAKARSPGSTTIAHSESVGTAATTIVGSVVELFVKTVSPPPCTEAVFAKVPLSVGITVTVIGELDPPGVMTPPMKKHSN